MADHRENVDLATKPEASNGADGTGNDREREDVERLKLLVDQAHALLKLVPLAYDLEARVAHEKLSFEEACAALLREVQELKSLGTAKDNPHDIRGSELAPSVLEALAKVRITGLRSVKTGIEKLDLLTGGLQAGVHVLAGEPGVGKTTFALQLAVAAVRSKQPAIFVSFEESTPRLLLRAVACWYNQKRAQEWESHLVPKAYEEGQGKLETLERVFEEAKEFLGALWIKQAPPRLDVADVADIARAAMEELKADRCLVVVDYLQRWASTRRGRDDFRFKVSELVAELRALALGLEIPVLVLSSQNRPGQGEARLTSLKESGDIEYSADTALFLTTDEKEDRELDELDRWGVAARNVTLSLAKNRYGDKGNVPLRYYADRHFFEERGK
jgi:replicative DNA helicase